MSRSIMKATVLGSGIMGGYIAALLAGAGVSVSLLDIVPEDAKDRNVVAKAGKDKAIKNRGLYDKSLASLIKPGNLEDDLSALRDSDFIIEAIIENLQIKKALYEKIAPFVNDKAIICSNTSGIRINEMCKVLPENLKSRFLGVHFFNPPRYMKLVELIPTELTDASFVEAIDKFISRRLGRGVVIAKDTPNFIANRVGTYSSIQILKLAEEYKYDFQKTDQLTGTFMGRSPSATCRTLDLVGIDLLKLISESVRSAVSEEEGKNFILPSYIDEMIALKNLGDKTGQGCFKYLKAERKSLVWDVAKKEYVDLPKESFEWMEKIPKKANAGERVLAAKNSGTAEGKFVWEAAKLLLAYSANKVPEITEDFRKIDLSMEWGYSYEAGPFKLWDQMGALEIVEEFKKEGIQVPAWVNDHLKNNNGKFYSEDPYKGLLPVNLNIKAPSNKVIQETNDVSLIDVGDNIALLEFHTKGNALGLSMSETIMEMTEIVKDKYDGLIIGNNAKQFSVGANLDEVAALGEAKEYDKLENSIRNFQKMTMCIKYLGKPVVAAPHAMTLGGGCEICLHSHAILAQAETYMGLVEAGVGLVPGGGGAKEMALRVSQWADQAKGADPLPMLKKLWENIAMAKVTSSGYEGYTLGYLKPTDKINMNNLTRLKDAKDLAISLQTAFRPAEEREFTVCGSTGYAALKMQTDFMLEGKWVSEYDAYIANKIAYIICGGNLPYGTLVTEQQILDLECEAFLSLAMEAKTKDRIQHMLKTGKPLRN